MCIAIVAQAGRVVPTSHLLRSASANRDGGGFAYVDKDNGKVVIKKGFMTASEFMRAYKEVLREGHGENNAMLIHFRIATLGKVNADNCHPFTVPGGAMIHNGCLWYGNGTGSMDCEKSDTREFSERISINLSPDLLKKVQPEMEKELHWNKLAFLFDDGDFVILNEDDGHWLDGVWYSNHSYRSREDSNDRVDEYFRTRYPALSACEYPGIYDDDAAGDAGLTLDPTNIN